MPTPTRFVFGLHLHQPVGNFDSVFEQHLREVYMPFLERVDERDFLPLVLHISGPLLEWLESHDTAYLDLVGQLASSGKLELLLAGMYEPVLASLPRQDRVEQISWMRDALKIRFGVEATGLWLTERVWEPELAADLADAGVRYALVDDRHFLVSGFTREQLHTPWITESDGKRVALFPIDERLRYLVPFRPPSETADYLRELAQRGHPLAVLADDGEKFGGWPGTREWVYERGWLDQFLTTVSALVDNGEVILSTLSDALVAIPAGGLAYLSTASYREMEGWSLPPTIAARLANLEKELGEERLNGPEGALIRGAHWRNFLVKYTESNRMHKKMQALSALCRDAGDPPEARRAVGRSQCNDAYWHGVFGGLYLPHLRDAIWRELALAEALLRVNEPLEVEVVDIDADGATELWLHGPAFSAIISPARGGVIEEYTVFDYGINYANTLTRRREVYHQLPSADGQGSVSHDTSGAASIHDMEDTMRENELPPLDAKDRVLIRERGLDSDLTESRYRRGDYEPAWDPADRPLRMEVYRGEEEVSVLFRQEEGGVPTFEKRYRFSRGGKLVVEYRWNAAALPAGGFFAPEISYAGPLELTAEPSAEVWAYDIATVAKSEKGLEQTVQGRSVTFRWPAALSAARIEVVARGR